MTMQNEAYWMDQLRNGNDKALAYFFDLHSKSLAYFAGRLLQDQEEAEDIVSKCFLKLWQRRSDFGTAQNVKAFLYISCRNACFDYFDSRKVRAAAQEHYFNTLASDEEAAFYEIVQAEVLDMVHKELEALPNKMRTVFKLLYLDGLTTKEISEQLGVSVQTVRNQKAKAIILIKNSLLKKGISKALQLALLYFLQSR